MRRSAVEPPSGTAVAESVAENAVTPPDTDRPLGPITGGEKFNPPLDVAVSGIGPKCSLSFVTLEAKWAALKAGA